MHDVRILYIHIATNVIIKKHLILIFDIGWRHPAHQAGPALIYDDDVTHPFVLYMHPSIFPLHALSPGKLGESQSASCPPDLKASTNKTTSRPRQTEGVASDPGRLSIARCLRPRSTLTLEKFRTKLTSNPACSRQSRNSHRTR